MSTELYRVHIMTRLHTNIVIYWAIVGAWHALAYYRQLREGERSTMVLQMQLAESQLRALRMQLHPHFLFNTLNSIAALVRKQENRPAVSMIVRLSEFLRLALENRGVHEVPLRDEVDFARRYLDIEHIRFGDALRVDVDIEASAEELFVPSMVLQPIVENAVHHGIAKSGQHGGRILIQARRHEDRLEVRVHDSGPGLSGGPPTGTGVGLSTTRQRLDRLYGDAGTLELRTHEEGGTVVIVSMPIVTSPVRLSDDDSQ
jgi:LytS/YehU family sensor histidine kinase